MRIKRNRGGVPPRTAWHPALVLATKAIFIDYWNVLEFQDEHQLICEPLRIDCVIKKAKGAIVNKDMAAIFRGVNLLEYKHPEKSLSIRGFYKVHSYVTLYASLNGTPITDITASFVGSRRPVAVMKHLRRVWGYTVEKTHPGIYTVVGAPFPMQFIDSRELSDKEGGWFRDLRPHDTDEGVRVFNRLTPRVKMLEKKLDMGAYMYALSRHNALAVEEIYNMKGKKAEDLKTVLERVGYNEEVRAEAQAEWEAQTLETLRFFVKQGIPIETVATGFRLSPGKVRELAGGKRR